MDTRLPDAFAAGTTVQFATSYGDFPANGGWGAVLYLAGASAVNAVGAATGAAFTFTLAATATAGMTPGNYQWSVLVTNAGVVKVADSGTVEVQPNLATATPGALLSWAQTTLPLVRSAIAGTLTGNAASYQIGNRSLVKLPLNELLALQSYCENKIRAEQSVGTFGDTVDVWFKEP